MNRLVGHKLKCVARICIEGKHIDVFLLNYDKGWKYDTIIIHYLGSLWIRQKHKRLDEEALEPETTMLRKGILCWSEILLIEITA